ncbi:phospholipid scramblase family member 5-like [Spea bombifrons]|uniref:phospholipid scramblase family member 5-like n=1 Tax=Spea bombifrons TaxID=233779 RepID=UPI0023499A21|nr:phospholipid scramblase family member 5-like [Spea bombifrons]
MASQEHQGNVDKDFPNYLPGTPDPSDQDEKAEPSASWKSSPPEKKNPEPRFLVPPGLEHLSKINQVIIHQQVELLGVFLGTEKSNKYEVKDSFGQKLYFAVEENLYLNKNLCGPMRPFTIRICNNRGHNVITVIRPLRCISCCFPCYLQELEVQAPPGTTAGFIVQKWDPLLPKFTIQNENKEDVLKIIGPYVTFSCLGDIHFEVKTLDENSNIGKISKYWSGFVNDVFTNADNFGIDFPLDLDVKLKAALIGTCFLIDLMYFEQSSDRF